MKKVIYSKFVERNLNLLPKYFSKYASILEDTRSLLSFHILKRKINTKPKIEGVIVVPTTICNANCVF